MLILRDVEELSNDEVASIEDDSAGSVKFAATSGAHGFARAAEQLTRHFGPQA